MGMFEKFETSNQCPRMGSVSADYVFWVSEQTEVKKEKDTNIVPCKWYSEVKYQVNCWEVKKYMENIFKQNTVTAIVFKL